MANQLELVDFDAEVKQLRTPPMIVNDIKTSTEEERENLKNQIYTLYQGDVMSIVPTCSCGNLRGEFEVGIECSNCGTVVESRSDRLLEPLLWLRAPHGVSKLINPHVWTMLNKMFSFGSTKYPVIKHIADPYFRANGEIPKQLKTFLSDNFKRGYNYFVDNFDYIINKLLEHPSFVQLRDSPAIGFLRYYRDRLFSQYLPTPNKTLLVVEENGDWRYIDPIITKAIDAILHLASIDIKDKKRSEKEKAMLSVADFLGTQSDLTEQAALEKITGQASDSIDDYALKRKENLTVKCIAGLAEYYEDYKSKSLGTKMGLIRKGNFSTRSHNSARAVITSITRPCMYDELEVPWGVGMGLFKYHLLNKLEKLNIIGTRAFEFLNQHASRYHPLIDKLFQELISESVTADRETGELRVGIPIILCRNPSLSRGSVQKFRIPRIKTDVNDPTYGLPIISVEQLNAKLLAS